MSAVVGAGVAAFGLLVGAVSGLLGVGGGLLIIPFVVLVLDKTQHVAEGISLVVIIPTAVSGVVAHSGRGYVSFRHAALLILGGIGGAVAGAKLALRLATDDLQLIFSIFLLAMAAHLLTQGLGAFRSGDRPRD